MTVARAAFLLISSAITLSACGGGGGGGDTPNNPPVVSPPTASQIIANAPDYTTVELQTSAKTLANAKYTGATNSATMDIVAAQKVFSTLFVDYRSDLPGILIEYITTTLANDMSTVECYQSGDVTLIGSVTSGSPSNINFTFDNCSSYSNDVVLNGKMAATINAFNDNTFDIVLYFDNFSWRNNVDQTQVSGYVELDADYTVNSYSQTESFYLNVNINDEPAIFLQAEANSLFSNAESAFEINGDLYLENEGNVSISSEGLQQQPPYTNSGTIKFTGDKTVGFGFEPNYVKYMEDTNGDNEFDVAAYLESLDELISGPIKAKNLLALDELTLPPFAGRPYLDIYQDIFTTSYIVLEPGYYEDDVTPNEDLTISYAWYLNDVRLADQDTNVLPAGIAVFGDNLLATMIVSDGVNVSESDPLYISIQDSPLQVILSNRPDNVYAGDFVTFLAQIVDPDLRNDPSNGSGTMIAAPENATMDSEGLVTWEVPDDLLFPYQNYEFTFAVSEEGTEQYSSTSVSILVESDKSFPIARHGMEVPKRNESMHVGDFDGDGLNEVLSTDSFSRVFLLANNAGAYEQKWVYPFILAKNQSIIQVLGANIDSDASLEIIVVTENSIYVINDLESSATLLYESDLYFRMVDIVDTNSDGVLEIAMLIGEDSYFADDIILEVISIDDPQNALFRTNVGDAKYIEFGNVDTDSNLELVTNNGRVYDAVTWENEWLSGNVFGDALLALGDFNNDGIDEIAGGNNWGNISVYSAVSRAQLGSFDNFNTCSLHSENVDSDASDEVITGDCQSGDVKAYSLINGQLVQTWGMDSLHFSGVISITVGDSDNDGEPEIHYGAGINSSGADKFITLDLNQTAAIVTKKEGSDALQLDQYASAGWSTLTDRDERAVFFIPSTESGYDGSVLATITETGTVSLSDEISSNWDYSIHAITTDFNNDGFGDVFVPSADYYDGAFEAIQLSNGVSHWKTISTPNTTVGLIKAFDVNGDGHDDGLYSDGRTLTILDVMDQSVLSNIVFESRIQDFTVMDINGTSAVVVSYLEKVAVYVKNGAVFSEQSFIAQNCERLEVLNYDSDAELEIICLNRKADPYSNTEQQLIVFEIQDSALVEVSRSVSNKNIFDFTIDPSKTQEQDLFLVFRDDGANYNYWNGADGSVISKATAQGKVIWTSPELIGRASSHGLRARSTNNGVQLLMATNQMMYWVK